MTRKQWTTTIVIIAMALGIALAPAIRELRTDAKLPVITGNR